MLYNNVFSYTMSVYPSFYPWREFFPQFQQKVQLYITCSAIKKEKIEWKVINPGGIKSQKTDETTTFITKCNNVYFTSVLLRFCRNVKHHIIAKAVKQSKLLQRM